MLDQHGRTTGALGDLDEALRVGRVLRAHDENDVTLARQGSDRVLSVLRRVADVVGCGACQQRKALAQAFDDAVSLIDCQRRLRQVGDPRRVVDGDTRDLLRRGDHLDALGRLAEGSVDLLVALVPDQDDVEALAGKPPRLRVDLCHEWTGRVDHVQSALAGLSADRRRDAVGGEDHRRAVRNLVELLDEHRAEPLELAHDVHVVHDLLSHVDRSPTLSERPADDVDGAHDARARCARRAKDDVALAEQLRPLLEQAGGAAQRAVGGERSRRRADRAVELVARAVGDDAEGHERARGGAAGNPRRLHVDRDRAALRELAPRARRERCAASSESGRCGPASRHDAGCRQGSPDWRTRPCHLALRSSLARTTSPGSSDVVKRAGKARDHDRARGVLGEPRRALGVARTDAELLDPGPWRAGAHGARLDPHRRQHDEAARARSGLEHGAHRV